MPSRETPRSHAPGGLELGAIGKSSLSLRFTGAWVKAATFAYTLTESFPLLGSHGLPTFGHTLSHPIYHAAAGTRAAGTVESETAVHLRRRTAAQNIVEI